MNRIWFILVLITPVFTFSCSENSSRQTTEKGDYLKIEGETMGTTYHITYRSLSGKSLKSGVDSLLEEINNEVSTYINTSFISKFNQSKEGLPIISGDGVALAPHFNANFFKSKEIFEKSEGAFDPTVMPLVNYWGFGYKEHSTMTAVDSTEVASILKTSVGLEKIEIIIKNGAQHLQKNNPPVELDFSAIAKGYGVDKVAEFIQKNESEDFLVEIGGELRASGKNEKGTPWTVGINQPEEGAALNEFHVKVSLSDLALATSGNYRNFYEVNGVKYSHTINPKTGFPERTILLSASIFTKDCMTADALATTCMVLGLEKAWNLINSMDGVDAYFMYGSEDGSIQAKYTSGLENVIK